MSEKPYFPLSDKVQPVYRAAAQRPSNAIEPAPLVVVRPEPPSSEESSTAAPKVRKVVHADWAQLAAERNAEQEEWDRRHHRFSYLLSRYPRLLAASVTFVGGLGVAASVHTLFDGGRFGVAQTLFAPVLFSVGLLKLLFPNAPGARIFGWPARRWAGVGVGLAIGMALLAALWGDFSASMWSLGR